MEPDLVESTVKKWEERQKNKPESMLAQNEEEIAAQRKRNRSATISAAKSLFWKELGKGSVLRAAKLAVLILITKLQEVPAVGRSIGTLCLYVGKSMYKGTLKGSSGSRKNTQE